MCSKKAVQNGHEIMCMRGFAYTMYMHMFTYTYNMRIQIYIYIYIYHIHYIILCYRILCYVFFYIIL